MLGLGSPVQTALPLGGGGGNPSCFSSPFLSLSRQNGPVCHVVDSARQCEAPTLPTPPAPGQVGGWGPNAQPGAFIMFPLRTETGEVRSKGGCQRVLEEVGGVTGDSVSGTLFQRWCRERPLVSALEYRTPVECNPRAERSRGSVLDKGAKCRTALWLWVALFHMSLCLHLGQTLL